jgi:hypothetical protein
MTKAEVTLEAVRALSEGRRKLPTVPTVPFREFKAQPMVISQEFEAKDVLKEIAALVPRMVERGFCTAPQPTPPLTDKQFRDAQAHARRALRPEVNDQGRVWGVPDRMVQFLDRFLKQRTTPFLLEDFHGFMRCSGSAMQIPSLYAYMRLLVKAGRLVVAGKVRLASMGRLRSQYAAPEHAKAWTTNNNLPATHRPAANGGAPQSPAQGLVAGRLSNGLAPAGHSHGADISLRRQGYGGQAAPEETATTQQRALRRMGESTPARTDLTTEVQHGAANGRETQGAHAKACTTSEENRTTGCLNNKSHNHTDSRTENSSPAVSLSRRSA